MTASTVQSTSGNYTGYITAVNTSFGFVRIAYTKDETTYEETIYCKDSSTTIITIEGKTKSMKDLEEGNTISVYGTMTNGAFVASSIIIISE